MLPTVAIPTYQRSQSIVVNTLAFLHAEGYPSELITLFVADQEEEQNYLRDVPSHLYKNIVVGVKGLAQQRNFISDYYPEGQILLQLDDDVAGVKILQGTFLELVQAGLKTLEEGCGLWGIMPNDDGRRLRMESTLHLTHIIGSIFLCKNHKEFRLEMSEKEDYLRSIWYFKKYGKVCRFRGAGVKTTYNKGTGGLIQPGREEHMRQGAQSVYSKYPECCSIIVKKGMPDLRLNWRASP